MIQKPDPIPVFCDQNLFSADMLPFVIVSVWIDSVSNWLFISPFLAWVFIYVEQINANSGINFFKYKILVTLLFHKLPRFSIFNFGKTRQDCSYQSEALNVLTVF